MAAMKRGWIFALMLGVVGVVVTIFVIDVRHDRKLLFDGFVEERLASTKELAAEMAARFSAVRKDVLFFKYLVEHSPAAQASVETFDTEVRRRLQRELQAILDVVGPYKEMHLVGPDGAVALSARESNWSAGADTDRVQRAVAAAALKAPSLAEGRIRISAPIRKAGRPAQAPGYRIFSASVRLSRGRRGAVLLLLEPDYLFGTLRAFRAPDRPRFALVDMGMRRAAYLSSPDLEGLTSELRVSGGEPSLAQLLSTSESGRAELPSEVAQRLRLGRFAVVTFAGLPQLDEWRFTLAAFSTATHLEERDQAMLIRTVAAMAAVLAGLGALGALLLRQVRRETELREHLRLAGEIRHLHELSQKLLDNIPSGLLALSRDLRVQQANHAMGALGSAARPGASMGEAFPAAAPTDVQRISRLLSEALERREPRKLLSERMALFHSRPGTYNLCAIPLDTPLHGVAVLLIIDDLSELKRLEQELVRAEKLSTIGILAAGIAHEIGTPLGVIRARAEHLLEKAQGGDGAVRSLQAIVEQSDTISRIIRQVLEFTRMREVQSQPVEIADVAEGAADLLREHFEKRGVTLSLSVGGGLPAIWADPDGLRQVLINLLRNACDACQPGQGVEVQASAESSGDEPFIRIEVRDSGCGIAPEHLHSIFDPFFTTKKGGEGVGLGLAIAQDIVKNHGGSISVESTLGRGSTFTVRWPAHEGAGPDRGSATGASEERA
jgi:signal transduction histidine kinase